MDTYLIYYKPEESWVGDVIPFFNERNYCICYLNERRHNGIPAEKTAWYMVETTDFCRYIEKGVVLQAGTDEEIDRSCYTGSVIQCNDGSIHLFYTAVNAKSEKFKEKGRPLQSIAHGSGTDIMSINKDREFVLHADGACDIYDWRDPFVFYSQEDQCYIMLISTRDKQADLRRGGQLYSLKSKDLKKWGNGSVFYAPDMYTMLECPECFQWGDWWYLIFSTFSEKYMTHYRISRSVHGPWMIPENDTFEGRAFYAAKTVSDGRKRYLTGWIPTKKGSTDNGKWEWAGNLAAHELFQETDGTLSVKVNRSMMDVFQRKLAFSSVRNIGIVKKRDTGYWMDAENGFAGICFDEMPENGYLEGKFKFSRGTSSFGIQLHTDEDLNRGYCYRFEPLYQRVVFDLWPRHNLSEPVIPNDFEDDRPFDCGLERPIVLSPDEEVSFVLLIDRDICTLYINGTVALTVRCCHFDNKKWGFFVNGGVLEVTGVQCKRP